MSTAATTANNAVDTVDHLPTSLIPREFCNNAYVRIQYTDMDEEMQNLAIKTALKYMAKTDVEKDIAKHIKILFDKTYGGVWQCIIGRQFGTYLSCERNTYLNFNVGENLIKVSVVVLKSH